jgi:hypothetical protein
MKDFINISPKNKFRIIIEKKIIEVIKEGKLKIFNKKIMKNKNLKFIKNDYINLF